MSSTRTKNVCIVSVIPLGAVPEGEISLETRDDGAVSVVQVGALTISGHHVTLYVRGKFSCWSLVVNKGTWYDLLAVSE